MRQLTYAKTIELDLSTARDDEYFNIAGTTIVALYRDGDIYIKLDSKSNTPLNLRQIPKIENADFQCFYVSNSAQPGKKAILLVGYNIDVDRQVLSLEELQSALNEMYNQTVDLAQATLKLKNLFVNGTLIVGPLQDDFIHDVFINYPEGVKGELPSGVTDRTELSPLAYMENLPEGTIITRYLYAGEKINVGNKVEIERTTGDMGKITVKDDEGNERIVIGESALPDGSDGVYANNVWIETIEDPETAYIIRPNGIYRKVNDKMYAVPSFISSGIVQFDGSSTTVKVTHNLNLENYDVLLFPEQYLVHDKSIPSDVNAYMTLRAYKDDDDPANAFIVEGYLQEETTSSYVGAYSLDGTEQSEIGSGTVNMGEKNTHSTNDYTYYAKVVGTIYYKDGSSKDLTLEHSYSDCKQYSIVVEIHSYYGVIVSWGDDNGTYYDENASNMDHFTYTVYDEHSGVVRTCSIQTSADINWAKVTGTIDYCDSSSSSFSLQHNYSSAGQYTITVKINYAEVGGSTKEWGVEVSWGDNTSSGYVAKGVPANSVSGSVYDGTGGTKHALKNTQIKYYIIK